MGRYWVDAQECTWEGQHQGSDILLGYSHKMCSKENKNEKGVLMKLVEGLGVWVRWQWDLNLLSVLCEVGVVNTTLMCYISKTPVEMVFASGFQQRLQEHSGGCYRDASKVPLSFIIFLIYQY